MSEEKVEEPAEGSIPVPEKVRKRDWMPSLIWLIPILAAVVGISLAVQTWLQRGPEITIEFRSAEGLEAGKTKVKYKEVQIGSVTAVKLAKDHDRVLVTVLLNKEAENFAARDSRFWVVRARMGSGGVSGLNTLLSGGYIGADAGIEKEKAHKFTGLEIPPIVTRDASGKQFVLRAADIGSLDVGSPIYFRRMEVGKVSSFDLDDDGKNITMRIFVNSPYDKFVGANTRFWHASGVEVKLSASGIAVNTQSLMTILMGGLAFQAPDDNMGPSAKENTSFVLAKDQAEALKDDDGEAKTVLLYFKQSVRGLTPGAEVNFRGLVLGQVKSIGMEYDRERKEFNMPVLVEIYPARIGRKYIQARDEEKITPQQRLHFLIKRGLAAQLRTGSLITGQLYVALDFFPEIAAAKKAASKNETATKAPPADAAPADAAPKDALPTDAPPTLLLLPTVPGNVEQIQAQVAELARKFNKIPFDQIGDELNASLKELKHTLNSTGQLAQRLNNDVAPEMAVALKDVSKTLNETERILSGDSPLVQDLRQTLQELSRAAASLRILTDYFELHPEAVIRGKQKDKQ
ncbi:intermembrane transport protein PqiB [Nitrosospira sp. Nsp13]|uniref:PqiB family protein n=1 Tax=Nitrosospira sp. Nsp13 TaxID=1855332 RepID=UPI000883DBAD|nr:MlaD family protein [Nitrosospira sp. Nsp13]SCY51041.1 paraquat-inducible protein B [Nitrosospira sp. Nsp13]